MKYFVAFVVSALVGAGVVWVLYEKTEFGRSALEPLVAAIRPAADEIPAKTKSPAPAEPEASRTETPSVPDPRPAIPPRETPIEPPAPRRDSPPVARDPAASAGLVRSLMGESETLVSKGEYEKAYAKIEEARRHPLLAEDESRLDRLEGDCERYYKLVVDIRPYRDPDGELHVFERKVGGKVVYGLIEAKGDVYVLASFGTSGRSRIELSRHDFHPPKPLAGKERDKYFEEEIEKRLRDAFSAYDFYRAVVRAVEYRVPWMVPRVVEAALAYEESRPAERFFEVAFGEQARALARSHFLYSTVERHVEASRYREILTRHFADTEYAREIVERGPLASAGGDSPAGAGTRPDDPASNSDPPPDEPENPAQPEEPEEPAAAPETPTRTSNPEVQGILAEADGHYDKAFAEIKLSFPGMPDCDEHLKKALAGFDKAFPLYQKAYEIDPRNGSLSKRLEKCRDLRAHCHKFQRL